MMTECAFVTGPTSGIGWAIARNLASRGAVVGLMGRRRDRAEMLAAEIDAAGGIGVPLIGDVGNSGDVTGAVDALVKRTGRLDTVVSNAGIAFSAGLEDTTDEAWRELMQTNLTGTFYVARATMPHLVRTKGSFTAISSDAGTQGAVAYAAYCASKHGVVGFVRCLALEYGPRGVRSNVVCPGFVETPMAEALLSSATEADRLYYKSCIPLGRFAKADEVAHAVAHLSSPQAAYVNGMVYAIDGGGTAGYFSGA